MAPPVSYLPHYKPTHTRQWSFPRAEKALSCLVGEEKLKIEYIQPAFKSCHPVRWMRQFAITTLPTQQQHPYK